MLSSTKFNELQNRMRLNYLKSKASGNQRNNTIGKTGAGGLKNKVAAIYGYRIPIPGGGSSNVLSKKPEISIIATKKKPEISIISTIRKKPDIAIIATKKAVTSSSNSFTTTSSSSTTTTVSVKTLNGDTEKKKSESTGLPKTNDPTFKRPIDGDVKIVKKVKISETNKLIADVIAKKRINFENMTVSPMKPLGPPPITRRIVSATAQPTSSVLQNQIRLLPKETHFKSFSTDPVLLKILEWSVQWLSKPLPNKIPPVADKPLTKLSLTYADWQSYYDVYEPLVLQEIWAQILQSYENEKSPITMMVAISCYEIVDGFLKIDCQSTISAQDFKDQIYLNEGDLTIAELQSESLEKRIVFAYVSDMVAEDITDRTPIMRSYKVPPGHRIFIKYSLKIKFRQVKLDTNICMRVRSTYYLKPMLRNIEALLALQNSKLCEDILFPRMVTCQMAVPIIDYKSDEYNESQLKAILASVEAIQRPYTMPKLLMVQGPPGTGKTTTLIGMIKKLFESWEDPITPPKLLVCAPSNGAIDEITRRIFSVRHFLNKTQWKRGLRCVRIGIPSQMHPSVRKLSLDELVCENMKNQKSDVQKGIQGKIDQLERDVASKDRLIANYRAKKDKENVEKCLSELFQCNREIEFLKKELRTVSEKMIDQNRKKSLRADILKKADVVLSTLNSCRQSLLEGLYHTDRDPCQFNCVIIDEASQCCEPEILMPLTYTSISKMILIGDPMQLSATVISPVASEYNYDRSLFERFFHHFGGYSKTSPVLMLDTQYRMHPTICKFPSQQFYNNRLRTATDLDKRPFHIKPYMVFDLKGTSFDQSNYKNMINELEADFVVNLYGAVREFCKPDHTIGVITPYQGQKKLLTSKLEKDFTNVDVNTIDGFQGQERDVIILSLVREFSKKENGFGFLGSPNRLNVALTRARHSLIICISDIGDINKSVWKNLLDDAVARKVLITTSCKVKNGLKKLIKLGKSANQTLTMLPVD